MKALVYHGPNILRYEDVPDVEPGPGEVKIKVKAVGICGSDVHGYLGITGRRIPPMTMGHEFSGVVEKLGPGVTTLKAGDRVSCFPFGFDGTCDTCKKGVFHYCENRKLYGVLTDDGAFADYLCVTTGVCIKLADSVSFEAGALVEPLTVGYHAATRIPESAIAGKNVFIVGAGTIGLMTAACVKMKNPAKLIVSDISDARLAVAKKMGADIVINAKNENAAEKVMALCGGTGADLGFEAVGASITVQQTMSALRRNGTAVWIGNSERMVQVNMQEVVTRELTIHGTNTFALEEFKAAAGFINSGGVDVSPLISHAASMAEGAAMFAKLAKDPGDWVKVLLVN